MPVMTNGIVLDAAAASSRGYDGLFGWLEKAESLWEKNKSSDNYTLTGLFDYFGQLSSQFPLSPKRVVYAKAGTQPAACLVRDNSIIENTLYWCPVATELEGYYLCAIINSEISRKRVEIYQARGQWGARHFDKAMFNLPIPRFDEKNKAHIELANAAESAEKLAAMIDFPSGIKFQRARSLVRSILATDGLSSRIDSLVAQLLDG